MRKVAIIGKAGTHGHAPWRDETWEIWGMPWISHPRVTRMFDIHSEGCWAEYAHILTDDAWLPTFNEKYPDIPVYCDPSRIDKFSTAVEYPLAGVMAALPIPFLENTIAYELALAIHEGVDEIGMWGVHMMARGEFAFERPSACYLVGLAQGRGIKVSISPGSPLFMSCHMAGRYGQAGGLRL